MISFKQWLNEQVPVTPVPVPPPQTAASAPASFMQWLVNLRNSLNAANRNIQIGQTLMQGLSGPQTVLTPPVTR